MPLTFSLGLRRAPFSRRAISLERVLGYRESEPRRIDFVRTHSGALRRASIPNRPEILGKFTVPFAETVKPIFEQETGLTLFPKPEFGNYFRSIPSEEEFDKIKAWIQSQGSRIFLRDCLDLSIALDRNIEDPSCGAYTKCGELEHAAKETGNKDAVASLSAVCIEFVSTLPFYRDSVMIAAVPPMSEKRFDLPSAISEQIAGSVGKSNLTKHFICDNPKQTDLKDAPIEEKWAVLEATGLKLDFRIPAGSDVILIDDKYQSGTTMQFVAMKLQEAGARYVFGISLVKTLRDKDNAS